MSRYFITSSGTGVGKTLITCALTWQLRQQGRAVNVLKPVISGYLEEDPTTDTAQLMTAAGLPDFPHTIASVSPWRFAAPLSPHMAARQENTQVKLQDITRFCNESAQKPGITLAEGVGGVMVPLNDEGDTVADWMSALNWPVILVAGSYLGAISHGLTALESLAARGLNVQAVIISESKEGVSLAETAATFTAHLPKIIGKTTTPVVTIPRITPAAGQAPWQCLPQLTELLPA